MLNIICNHKVQIKLTSNPASGTNSTVVTHLERRKSNTKTQSQSYSLIVTLKHISLFYTKFTHSNTGQFSINPLHETGEFKKPVTN